MSSVTAPAPLTAADTLPLEETSPVARPPTASSRLVSLDIFRGATIAMMLLVNNPGGDPVYGPLDHAPWNGWTPTDFVFPFFLFIMGVAVPFSLRKRGQTESKGELFLHVLARGLSLFVLGELCIALPLRPFWHAAVMLTAIRAIVTALVLAGIVAVLYPWKSKRVALLVPVVTAVGLLALAFAMHFVQAGAESAGWSGKGDSPSGVLNPDVMRIPGILQRIGICYAVAASLALVASWHVLVLASLVVMAVYSWLMLHVNYPSLTHPGQMVHGLLGEEDNLARFVDTRVFGKHAYRPYPDSEGLISTLPAIATAIFGVLAGRWLRSDRTAVERCAGLLAAGVAVACVGSFMGESFIPVNKHLWTPSFAVFCSGMAMLGLGAVFYAADVLGHRWWGLPLRVYGMNAILAFVLASVVTRVLLIVQWHSAEGGKLVSLHGYLAKQAARIGPHVPVGDAAMNGSLAFAVGYVLFILLILSVFYRLKIYLKV